MAFPQDISITNGDAEGPGTTGWTNGIGTNFRVTSSPTSSNVPSGSAHGGGQVFNGGSASSYSAYQTVDISSLSSGDLADIDAGKVLADLYAWCYCEADGTDRGMVTIEFLSSADVFLGGWQSNAYNGNAWNDRGRKDLLVPASTRKIKIELAGYRAGGDAYVDVAWDDIKVTLKTRASGLAHEVLYAMRPISGDESQWTATRANSGTSVTDAITNPISTTNGAGDYWAYWPGYRAGAANVADVQSYHDISIPSGWNTAIDAGNTAWYWNHKQHVDGGEATMRTYWEFLDGSNALIGSRNYSDASEIVPSKADTVYPDVWNFMAIPANTRKVRFGMYATKLGGTSIHAWLLMMQFAIVNEAPPPPFMRVKHLSLESAIADQSARMRVRQAALENAVSDQTARFSARTIVLEVARSLKPRKTPLIGYTLSNTPPA